MHSATHVEAEHLLDTYSYIRDLGLDSSLEPHAVSGNMQIGVNVTMNCVHPGIVRTRLAREREGLLTNLVFFLASKLLKTIPEAATMTCYVATHPRLFNVSGKYFADCSETSTSKLGSNSTEAARL
ncbi:Short-chain dehydrogenase TIC 32, chloroplastic [Glycine soja]